MRYKKILIILSAIICLVTLGFIFVVNSKTKDGAEVIIRIAPADATIVVDSTLKAKNGSNRMQPGKHNIAFSRVGFIGDEIQFVVTKEGPNVIVMGLTPNSEEGNKYVEDNQKEFIENDGYGSEEATRKGKLSAETYPLINKLPLDVTPQYRIDFGISKKYPDDSSKIAIYISSASLIDKSDAIQMIYDIGYDPSDYEIIFRPL